MPKTGTRVGNKKSCMTNYVKLEGSLKAAPAAVKTGTLNTADSIEVTVRLRRKQSIEAHLKEGKRFTREEYENTFGASDDDIQEVEAFASDNHLSVVTVDKGRRSIILAGSIADFETAFQVHLSSYRNDKGETFRGRVGHICVPDQLKDIVEGVFGLDNRPHVSPRFQALKNDGHFVAHKASTQSFNPNQLADIYGFPTGVNGKGQSIAIIELGGGYRTKDLKKYFAGLNVHKPSVVAVSVDHAKNSPSNADGADGEVMLDIEVAGAVAPGAKIVVYFAPNTDQGFLDAITKAIHDNHHKPSVISISWGSAEKNWTTQSLNNYNEAFKAASLLGVTICVAAGDQGSADGLNDGKAHADFPAASPYVLACGGTKLIVQGNNVSSESVWHESNTSATGGGVSEFFAVPDYQSATAIPTSVNNGFKGRGLPDVAGNADPNTGYNVLVDGQEMVIGGTSAVAPLMAGLIALINEGKQQPVGFINPALYNQQGKVRDITQGDNITTSTNKGYKAGAGWDACTGWGVLSGL